MSGQASIQMRVDVGLRPGNINPHTFIAVTHPDGRQTEYGLVPASPGDPSEVMNMGQHARHVSLVREET